VTFPFEVGGQHYRAIISCFADGRRAAEIFLANGKSGSQADANCRDAVVAASLALQFGCPLEVLRNAFLRDIRGMAATPLGAVLDLVAEQQGINSGAAQ
jgi:ribonucleoside-diphosphate reductase alpha chain